MGKSGIIIGIVHLMGWIACIWENSTLPRTYLSSGVPTSKYQDFDETRPNVLVNNCTVYAVSAFPVADSAPRNYPIGKFSLYIIAYYDPRCCRDSEKQACIVETNLTKTGVREIKFLLHTTDKSLAWWCFHSLGESTG
jgi:hypothetical protein